MILKKLQKDRYHAAHLFVVTPIEYSLILLIIVLLLFWGGWVNHHNPTPTPYLLSQASIAKVLIIHDQGGFNSTRRAPRIDAQLV